MLISAAEAVPATPRSRSWAPLATALVLLATAASMVAANVLEQANRPYTANFVTAEDVVVASALFCIPVLGAVLLWLRPGHWTGRIMLGSGLLGAVGFLCHAVAIRLILVDGTHPGIGEPLAWLATSTSLPFFGLLPFAVATWPEGRIETAWLRLVAWAAGFGLALATLAQAFAPDKLDGVARGVIANPYGQRWLDAPARYVTTVGVAVLAAFGIASAADTVWRAWHARAMRRRQLVPVASVIVLGVVAVVAGAFGGNPFIVLIFITPVAGAAMVAAAWGRARLERSERARAQLVMQRENERLRVRRDLHDGVGPLLAALRLELDAATDPAATTRARALLDDAIGEVRRITRDLRPTALDDLGLVGAIHHQAETLTTRGGPRFVVAVPAAVDAVPPAVEVAALRIVAEAMTNVVRHAEATMCSVSLDVDGAALRLRVIDDGTGLGQALTGTGMTSMRTRAEELGGLCQVHEAPGGGTVVDAVIPLGPG